jgi:hypothetical protein
VSSVHCYHPIIHMCPPSMKLVRNPGLGSLFLLFFARVAGDVVDVLVELVEVVALLLDPLLELKELFPLALADGHVLRGALAALKGITLASSLGGSSHVAGGHGASRRDKGGARERDRDAHGRRGAEDGLGQHFERFGGGMAESAFEVQSFAFLAWFLWWRVVMTSTGWWSYGRAMQVVPCFDLPKRVVLLCCVRRVLVPVTGGEGQSKLLKRDFVFCND